MVFIPAEYFKNPALGKAIIDTIDLIEKIVPREDPTRNFLRKFNENRRKASLLFSNKGQIQLDLNDTNIEDAIKRFRKSEEIYKNDLPNIRKKYGSYQSAGNSLANRFTNSKKSIIKGIGMDASGERPKNFSQENRDLSEIEEVTKRVDGWNIGNEEYLKQSIANVLFWQSSNFSQLPIGTPTQLVSAIVELINCERPKGAFFEYNNSISGSNLITKRKECAGLSLLLDGNKYDIDDSGLNGKKRFLDTTFRRMFYSKENDKGIWVKVGADQYTSTGIQVTTANSELMNNTFYESIDKLLKKKHPIGSDDEKKAKYGAIMLIYAVFLNYISYIYNLYEYLIASIRNDELKNSYRAARSEAVKSLLNLVNYCINKFFKLGKSFQDLIVAGFEEEQKGKFSKGPGKPSSGDKDKWEIKYSNNIEQVLDSMRLEEYKSKIIIGFKDATLYEEILEKIGGVDDDAFSKERYPIVFTDASSNTAKDNIINYVETIKKLVPFLLRDKEPDVPKTKDDVPIAVGAPFQNEDILDETAEALYKYYGEVMISKSFYLEFMEQKIAIFMAGIPATEISQWKDMIFKQLGIIARTIPTMAQKDIECLDLIQKIVSRYRDYRKQEIKLMDSKSILVDNKFRILGNKPEDYVKQQARAMKRLHMGVKAVLLVEVVKLSFELFKQRNPTLTLCSNFETEFTKRISEIDKSMNEKISSILVKKVLNIEKKAGPKAIKNSKLASGILMLAALPPAPTSYARDVWSLISSVKETKGLPMMGPSSSSYGFGQQTITYDQKNKIENDLFWKNLYTAFNSRLLFLPAVKGTRFDDDDFYIVDIFSSMVDAKLYKYRLSLDAKFLYYKLYQKGYIMFTPSAAELDNPSNWKAINLNSLEKALKKTNNDKIRNIKQIRDLFFNIIANDSFLAASLTISIPDRSRLSQVLQAFCQKAKKTNKYSQCDILISRNYFGNTVSQNMQKFEGTYGIDMTSGTAFAQYSEFGNVKNVVVRT